MADVGYPLNHLLVKGLTACTATSTCHGVYGCRFRRPEGAAGGTVLAGTLRIFLGLFVGM